MSGIRMDRTEILLAEYSEAGEACRAQEQYVRFTLNMYLVFAVALGALMAVDIVSNSARTWISFMGFVVGLCMFFLTLRHQRIYCEYVKRAKKIEAELQMDLYSQTNSTTSKEPTAKEMSAFIIGATAFFFLVAGFFFACKM